MHTNILGEGPSASAARHACERALHVSRMQGNSAHHVLAAPASDTMGLEMMYMYNGTPTSQWCASIVVPRAHPYLDCD